jgi:hypothetical protein
MGENIERRHQETYRGPDMGERSRRHPWQRTGGPARRQGRGNEGRTTTMSLAHIRLRISERFREAKDTWHANPAHHGTEEIPPPPPKKSMLDRARNSIARTAAQIRTGHWRSAVYLKRIRKRETDHCWLCEVLGRINTGCHGHMC